MVIATDRRVDFLEARNNPRIRDFPFTLIEMQLDKEGSGEGRMAVATRISRSRDGESIELENYGAARRGACQRRLTMSCPRTMY